MGTKKGQQRETARRAYNRGRLKRGGWDWEVTAQTSHRMSGRLQKREVKARFKTKAKALVYARQIARMEKGSNPRVRKVK